MALWRGMGPSLPFGLRGALPRPPGKGRAPFIPLFRLALASDQKDGRTWLFADALDIGTHGGELAIDGFIATIEMIDAA